MVQPVRPSLQAETPASGPREESGRKRHGVYVGFEAVLATDISAIKPGYLTYESASLRTGARPHCVDEMSSTDPSR